MTMSAAAIARAPRRVIRSAAPGPAPMKVTLPVTVFSVIVLSVIVRHLRSR
jgi:hypothetical protein